MHRWIYSWHANLPICYWMALYRNQMRLNYSSTGRMSTSFDHCHVQYFQYQCDGPCVKMDDCPRCLWFFNRDQIEQEWYLSLTIGMPSWSRISFISWIFINFKSLLSLGAPMLDLEFASHHCINQFLRIAKPFKLFKILKFSYLNVSCQWNSSTWMIIMVLHMTLLSFNTMIVPVWVVR